MQLDQLIAALSEPKAYPFPVKDVEVLQTHISVVFLAGPFAFKIKKPVKFGFVDFSTLEKRRHFCEREVQLNRRLAPNVYLGTVPVGQTAEGLQVEGAGQVVEWGVKMQRLPESATLRELVRKGTITVDLVKQVATTVASFHRQADKNEAIAEFGRFDAVARNVRDLFLESEPQVGSTASPRVFERLQQLVEQELARHKLLIEERARAGWTRDLHGDLHLDHIYCFPEKSPPDDLVIVDCIEFNDRFRFLDVVADMAFPVMDFASYGRRDLARAFAEAYFQATKDRSGQTLVPLYTAYRAMVRAAVEGLKLREKEITDQAATVESCRAHWLLALAELEEPIRKPCLVLIGGLPGTGKSVLARGLSRASGFEVIRSDIIRKQLAGLPAANVAGTLRVQPPSEEADILPVPRIYTPEWNERTYAECLRQAKQLLFEGRRVIIDATFREDNRRGLFLDTAARSGVQGMMLLCRAKPETIRRRLDQRRHDVSDADWAVHLQLAQRWKEPGEQTARSLFEIRTDGSEEESLVQAIEVLRDQGLS
jgi:aminoglycoside phosphotransferase family enzyme/predicted kinase